MKRIAIILAALATVSTAYAQEFNGTCSTYNEQAACQATQWCAWRKGREIATPDGGKVEIKGTCAFRPHMKAAWAAKTQTTPQQ